jgi:hypothetical protein
MTSDSISLTAAYGSGTYVSSGSSLYWAGREAYKAFDKSTATHFEVLADRYTVGLYNFTVSTTYDGASTVLGEWLQIQTPTAIAPKAITLCSRAGWPDRLPNNFLLLGSNNGTSWSLIANSASNSFQDGVTKTVNLPRLSLTPYTYHRLVAKTVTGGDTLNVAEWSLLT